MLTTNNLSEWVDFSDVSKKVAKLLESGFEWRFNADLKYLEIVIDMRDGKCRLKNRHGVVINMNELDEACRKATERS